MDTKQQRIRDCRLASRLQDQILAGRKEALVRLLWKIGTCTTSYQNLQRLRQRLESCHDRHFESGIECVKGQLRRMLPEMIEQLTCLNRILAEDRPALVTCNDLVGELQQVRQEFGDSFEYHHKDRTLSVQTDDIELHDEFLGPFEIRLDLSAIGQPEPRRTYKVIAVDPHPAAGDDGITHPHVSDERLCEGEATLSIRNALKHGRLGDLFLLVAGVLGTYNPGSAYVSLDRWSGPTCHDSGTTISRGEAYTCDRCEAEFCDGCTRICQQCDRTVCNSCSSDCEGCSKNVCNGCIAECSQCHGSFCEDCLTDGACNKCREQQQPTLEPDHEEQAPQSPAIPAT